jgi:hypothetical protein
VKHVAKAKGGIVPQVPAETSLAIGLLTDRLNWLRGLVKIRGESPEIYEARAILHRGIEQIEAASWVLREQMLRMKDANSVDFAEEHLRLDIVRAIGPSADVALLSAVGTLDRLAVAIQEVKSLGLLSDPQLRDRKILGWRDVAQDIVETFDALFPEIASKEARYRLLAQVVPEVTGETPTVGSLKALTLRKREVVKSGEAAVTR